MDMIGRIRRLHVRDKLSEREIARMTGLSRNTVSKWLRASVAEAPKYRSDMHHQQVAQRVHGHVDFAAALALIAVVARTRAALAARLQRAPIHHYGAGLTLAILRYANDGAQVRDHRLEATGVQPAPALLIDRLPGR